MAASDQLKWLKDVGVINNSKNGGDNETLISLLVEAIMEKFQDEIDEIIREAVEEKVQAQIQSINGLSDAITQMNNNKDSDKIIKNGFDAIFSNMTKEGQAIVSGMKKVGEDLGKKISDISLEFPESQKQKTWEFTFSRNASGYTKSITAREV